MLQRQRSSSIELNINANTIKISKIDRNKGNNISYANKNEFTINVKQKNRSSELLLEESENKFIKTKNIYNSNTDILNNNKNKLNTSLNKELIESNIIGKKIETFSNKLQSINDKKL